MKGTTGGAAVLAAIAAALVVFGVLFLPRLRSDHDDTAPPVIGGKAVLIGFDTRREPSKPRCRQLEWNEPFGRVVPQKRVLFVS
jgi:hypothetical protein